MFRGFLSTWAGLIVNGVVGILLTPILVHGLGAFYYGLWILVASVLDYYGLLDMGMRYSLQRFTARYGGANDRTALNETFMTGLAVSVWICSAVFVVGAVFVVFLPGFFKLQGQSVTLFRILLGYQGITLALSFPARIMGAYMCGLRRFDLYNALASTQGILKGIVFWLVIRMHGGINGIAIAQLAIAAVLLVLSWIATRYTDPGLTVSWKYTSRARTKELASFSFYILMGDVGDRLRFFTDVIVISHFLTVALATPFNVIGKLMEIFRMVFYPITGPLTTEANALEGQKRSEESRQLFLRSSKICALLAFAGTAVLLLQGKNILRVWMGEPFTAYYSLLVVLTTGYCVYLMQMPALTFLNATGHHRMAGSWALIEGVLNLGLSIYWAKQYGLLGVAMGTAVPMIIMRLGIQPLYTLRVLKLPLTQYVSKSLLRPIAVVAIVYAVARSVGLIRSTASRLGLLEILSGFAVLFGVSTYWIVLDGSERKALRRRAVALLNRRGVRQEPNPAAARIQ